MRGLKDVRGKRSGRQKFKGGENHRSPSFSNHLPPRRQVKVSLDSFLLKQFDSPKGSSQ